MLGNMSKPDECLVMTRVQLVKSPKDERSGHQRGELKLAVGRIEVREDLSTVIRWISTIFHREALP